MERTYPLESLRRSVFLAIAAVILGMGVVLAGISAWVLGAFDEGGPGLGVLDLAFIALPLVVMGGIAAVIAWATSQVALSVSEAGVVLDVPGARFSAGWDSISHIGVAALGPLTGEALVLRRPATAQRAWWFIFLRADELREALPLTPFALPLRGSRLEAAIRFHAPRLFELPEAPPPSPGVPLPELW